MFIKTAKFKSLLREAHKMGALRLYRPDEENVVILTGYCIFKILIKEMTAKEKAAVIEFAGCFPEVGEAFKVGEDGNQMILETTIKDVIKDIDRLWEDGSDNYSQTYVLVDTGQNVVRAVQSINDNRVIWFQDRFINCVHLGSMGVAETSPEHFRICDPMYIMKNNIMTVCVLKFDLKNSQLDNMELYGKARTDDSDHESD